MVKMVKMAKGARCAATKECPYCSGENPMVAKECQLCGFQFFRFCAKCGKPSSSSEHKCTFCGEDFKKFCPKCGFANEMIARTCGREEAEGCDYVFWKEEELEHHRDLK